ncbi:MAG: T9SS type A sorting domain-containing protein [Chitinophagaceae bacterium]
MANWPLTSNLAGTGTAYNTVSNVSGGPAISLLAFNGSDFYAQDGWPTGGLATNAYLQFSIKANTGYQLDLTSVVMKLRRSTTGTSGSGPTKWSLRSSLDGYTTDLYSGNLTTGYVTSTVNLTGFYFLSGTVIFRLYGYNTLVSSGGGLSRVVVGGISITGLVTLPVLFKSFTAQYLSGDKTQVQWSVQNVSAGTDFYLQRSVDGINFSDIWTKEVTTDMDVAEESYTDRSLPATASKIYYRLRTEEPGGRNNLSSIVMVSRQVSPSLVDKIIVEGTAVKAILQLTQSQHCSLAVLSIDGRLMQQQETVLQQGSNTVWFQKNMPHGIYILRVQAGNNIVSRQFSY